MEGADTASEPATHEVSLLFLSSSCLQECLVLQLVKNIAVIDTMTSLLFVSSFQNKTLLVLLVVVAEEVGFHGS